ncbi:MAG: hypothetical protein WAN04_10605, partial [Candidatus Udaeobacter sp.]
MQTILWNYTSIFSRVPEAKVPRPTLRLHRTSLTNTERRKQKPDREPSCTQRELDRYLTAL